MTVAAALAVAVQKTARASGEPPGVLKEPEVQLEAATVGYGAAGAPLLAVSSLRGADGVDDTAVRTLLKLALQKKVEEEEERKLKVEELRQASLASARELHGSKRKRKKRRKKRTPRVSSLFRARRRHRQLAGFAGCVSPRVVFPLVDDSHLLLCNTAGMDQKDSFIVVAMAVVYARQVLLVSLLALCSLLSLSGPDARHHGRYVLEGGLRRAVHKLRIIRSLSSSKSSSFLSLCRGGFHGFTDHRNSTVAGQGR